MVPGLRKWKNSGSRMGKMSFNERHYGRKLVSLFVCIASRIIGTLRRLEFDNDRFAR